MRGTKRLEKRVAMTKREGASRARSRGVGYQHVNMLLRALSMVRRDELCYFATKMLIGTWLATESVPLIPLRTSAMHSKLARTST